MADRMELIPAPELLERAEALLEACRRSGLRLATAESCTGGLLAGCLTAIPGSSEVLERGFVTYSNDAKIEMLGVDPELLHRVGAVSAEVAEAMARGAVERSHADLAVSVTGIAGPGGATAGKPVGLVFLGLCAKAGTPSHQRYRFPGDRAAVRHASIDAALRLMSARLTGGGA